MAPDDWFKNQEGKVVWFDNKAESFTSQNGDQWENVGSNLQEVGESLNLPENTNVEWKDLEFVSLGGSKGNGKGAFGPAVLESSAQVSFSLNVENGGEHGLELIDGETEITGVNINMTVSTETDAPGVQLSAVGGNFGIQEWNATGNNNINSSSSFSPIQTLSGASSHASGSASLTLGLSSFNNLTRKIERGGSMNLGVNSIATFNLQQNGRKGFFKTSNTIKIN